MENNAGGHGFWQLSSEVCFLAAYGTTALAAVWFAFINFLGDELHHPLDFFSNKLRTRPYWYIIVLMAFAGLLVFDNASGEMTELQNTLPELVVTIYVEGFMLVGTMMMKESAGAAMVTMLGHMIVSKGLVITVTILPAAFLPGAFYSNCFLIIYMFFVFFLQMGAERHAGYLQKPEATSRVELPEGADRVPRLWAKAILYGNPVLMIVLDIMFLAVFLMSRGEYGKALTICYSIVATLLLMGCCSQYRAGTTVDD